MEYIFLSNKTFGKDVSEFLSDLQHSSLLDDIHFKKGHRMEYIKVKINIVPCCFVLIGV